MALLRIEGPVGEPVLLDDAKLHLRVDTADEDALIGNLITAARAHLEQVTGRVMLTQTWIDVRDAWPVMRPGWVCPVHLQLAPVREVIEVRVVDADGVAQPVADEKFFTDLVSNPARLVANDEGWPAPGQRVNGIEIEFAAGHGDAPGDVPAPLRQAVLLLVAHWYERREPVVIGAPVVEVPQTVAGLIAPFRRRRLA